jgi:hypothetical protein
MLKIEICNSYILVYTATPSISRMSNMSFSMNTTPTRPVYQKDVAAAAPVQRVDSDQAVEHVPAEQVIIEQAAVGSAVDQLFNWRLHELERERECNEHFRMSDVEQTGRVYEPSLWA